jgi:ribosome recycling factor
MLALFHQNTHASLTHMFSFAILITYMAYDFSTLKTQIKETEEWLQKELTGIRTGRASPILLDGIKPEAYGTHTPLTQVASVSIEDARTLRIVPWDKTLTKAIEKAVVDADLGVGTAVDDMGVRVTFPELTSDRRVMLVRLANERKEEAKVRIRGARTEALHALDASEKEGGMGKDELARLKAEVQKYIDAGVETLEGFGKKKETEIAS